MTMLFLRQGKLKVYACPLGASDEAISSLATDHSAEMTNTVTATKNR